MIATRRTSDAGGSGLVTCRGVGCRGVGCPLVVGCRVVGCPLVVVVVPMPCPRVGWLHPGRGVNPRSPSEWTDVSTLERRANLVD